MEYEKLVLVAPAWREVVDPKTKTRYVKADFSVAGSCDTIMTPVPGSDPVEYTYECLPVTCDGDCKLRKRELPDGTIIVFCKCSGGGGSGAAVSTAGRSSSKAKKAIKKKAAGKKKTAKASAKKPKKNAPKR